VKVLLYLNSGKRAKSVVQHMQAGIAQAQTGDKIQIVEESTYRRPEQADVVILYGLRGNGKRILAEYGQAGVKTVWLDLSYFGRKHEPISDYHRVACGHGDYQPTNFRYAHPPDRFFIFNREIHPWQTSGEEILVAGMSEKSSQIHGLGPATTYATWLVDEVRKYTDRPIAFRPKPSWPDAEPIPGTRYAVGSLEAELQRAWATVSWGSNVALDGLLAGVPCFVLSNHPASLMGFNDLHKIETPLYPEDRLGFFSDLCYCQWSLREMSNGTLWRYYRKMGLL
jgi:hypothetical protein